MSDFESQWESLSPEQRATVEAQVESVMRSVREIVASMTDAERAWLAEWAAGLASAFRFMPPEEQT